MDNTSQIQHIRDDFANVLIVDNDPDVARFMLAILAGKGIRGHLVNDEKNALHFLEKSSCDLVFIGESILKRTPAKCAADIIHPESEREGPCWPLERGFELLQRIRGSSPEMPVVMIGEHRFDERSHGANTTQDDKTESYDSQQAIAAVVKAIRAGCYEFLPRPLDHERIENLLDTLLPNHRFSAIASANQDTHCLYRIVGRSAKLAQTVNLAKRVAPTSASVLIRGESGTGKELISYLIHHQSRRAQGPYVKVNCAALNDSLLESELFGHEKGAFTGAYSQRKGRFEMADCGTLLLDEITETPPRFQAKLLRVLEQQDFERVGGNENVRVDVRIISTTNKDLLQEVREGRFRQDLYYRLAGVRLDISPLRERKEDLPDLVWHFINLYAREVQRRITKLDPVMMDIFANYHWPGNIRQLRNVVRTSLVLGVGETLSLADVSWLFDELQPAPQERQGDLIKTAAPDDPQRNREDAARGSGLGGMPLEEIERQAILDTLRQTSGNQTKAAKALGISDRTLRDKIRRYRQEGCLQLAQ